MRPLTPAPDLATVVADSGIAYPNERPLSDIAFVLVAYEEEWKLARLLAYIKPWFSEIAVGVQRGIDRTEEIARQFATHVVLDEHRGYGDATFPKLLKGVKSKWSFRIDSDEWPEKELLDSLSSLRWVCERDGAEGAWIPFRSWIEDLEWEQPHSHLRFFQTRLGWPPQLHSRPPTEKTYLWQQGSHILHRKSLQEHLDGYVGYYHAGRGNDGWTRHNIDMIRAACSGIADRYGWDFVKSVPAWRAVQEIAYKDVDPAMVTAIAEP